MDPLPDTTYVCLHFRDATPDRTFHRHGVITDAPLAAWIDALCSEHGSPALDTAVDVFWCLPDGGLCGETLRASLPAL
jgi:hypothetical protein